MTRFLCTGDLHLGAGTVYGREPGDRLKDQEATLGCIVELARDHEVDAILFAGDAFEGPTVTPEQYAVFQEQLRGAPCPVIAITGNGKHDCAMRDVTAPQVVSDVAEIFARPDVRLVGDTAVCCLPWAPVSRLVAQRDGGDRDEVHEDAAALVVRIARGLREDATALGAHRAVLMLHWSISGAALPNGLPVDELREPVIPLEELEALGFDAVVAGHIHRPQLLSPGPLAENGDGSHVVASSCPIFYVGSPMPLNFGEGQVHGCWLLDLDEPIRPHAVHAEFVALDSRPFITIDIDLTPWGSLDGTWTDTLRELARDRNASYYNIDDAVVRLKYRASEEQARRIDHPALIRSLYDAGAHKVFIQPEIVRAQRARVDGVDESLAPMTALDLWLEAEHASEPQRRSLRALAGAYLEAVS